MTDDLSMQALAGRLRGRGPSGALAAGCDIVLHCNGDAAEMAAVAEAAPALAGRGARRGPTAALARRGGAAGGRRGGARRPSSPG